MKNRTTIIITALAMTGSAWATSPYDTAYGIQWNFMAGVSGDDGGSSLNTALDVTSDGTVFVHNRTGVYTWGSGTGGNVCGGLGAITPLGNLLYGTTVSSLPTLNSASQQYAAGVSAAGNKAYFTVYGAQSQYWVGEDGKDPNRAMVWSLDSTGLGSIANQRSISKYTGASGNPLRTDLLTPTTTGLTPAAGQNRILMSDLRDSTLDMVVVGDMVAGDFGTAGDYEGYLLRTNGTQPAYLPGIAVYNFNTNTFSGPAKQPILTYSGASPTWSNMGDYRAAGIDQNTGRYYGGGISHGRTESTSDAWDPDGSGPAASIPFVTSINSTNPAAIGTAYDSANNLLYSVTWDTTGYDVIYFIAPTNDGSNGVFWAGEKLDDCYIELRDASGAVTWSDSFDKSPSVGVERVTYVSVDAAGDLLVTGYFENGGAGGGSAAYDTFVRKYKKTGAASYTVQWDTTFGLAGVQDLISKCALDPTDKTLYTVSRTDGAWTNTTGHANAGGGDLLVQKLTPGDFNTDGLVDFADVQIAGTATKPGLPGNDTYDFNGDGDSTLADTTFMITNVMDRAVGDIQFSNGETASDVDNADIGKAIGSLGTGTLYLDGDFDFDGDVDSADLTAMATAFTGAEPTGVNPALSAGATLRYRASDGQVWIYADEATGGIITSFQLENSLATFLPANFTNPTGGSFGGALKDATTKVIADTDLTLAGASGLVSLGTILPAGMDLAGLQAYLKTAVYTGQQGSGQKRFALVVGDIPTAYGTWTMGFPSLTDISSNIDFDNDGLNTGIEYVLGGDPTLNDAASIAPTSVYNGSDLVFTFRRTDLANTDPATTISVAYSTDLQTWTTAQDTVAGVSIVAADDFYGTGIDRVVATLPSSLASGGKLFARLTVSGLPATLLTEDFESGNGGFTLAAALTGTPWAYGTPNSTGFGGTISTGNNSSAKCWGTGNGALTYYADPTDTRLRSPVIDLTGMTTAELTFAQAIDLHNADSVQVNIINATTDTVIQSNIIPIIDGDINSANWTSIGPVAIPVAALGQPVRIEWHLSGTGGSTDDYMGWYIDDVKVTARP